MSPSFHFPNTPPTPCALNTFSPYSVCLIYLATTLVAIYPPLPSPPPSLFYIPPSPFLYRISSPRAEMALGLGPGHSSFFFLPCHPLSHTSSPFRKRAWRRLRSYQSNPPSLLPSPSPPITTHNRVLSSLWATSPSALNPPPFATPSSPTAGSSSQP